MLEAVNFSGYRLIRRPLLWQVELGALRPWTGTKESAPNAQRRRCKWFFQVFVEVSQRTGVQYDLNLNQHCFELFVTDSCITEGFLRSASFVQKSLPTKRREDH